MSDPRFPHRPLNGCGECRADFTSLRLFEAHRVGDHALDYLEHEDGRRCLDVIEMAKRGWLQDAKGRWSDPAHAARARDYFSGTATPCTGGPNSPAEDSDELEAA
jgi:hypothetical protein